MNFPEIFIYFMVYSYFGTILEHLAYFIERQTSSNLNKKLTLNPISTGFPLYGFVALIK